MLTIKQALDSVLGELVIDKKLLDRVYRYHIDYLNQTKDYLDFFGGNLLGVHVVRFTQKNIQNFFNEVLKTEYLEVVQVSRQITTINQDFKISSDPMNLVLMYLIHRVGSESKLGEKDRVRGMYDLALVFFYRCITIRQSEYFHFPADPKIAQAAYAALSNKFLIKQLGSWKAVMAYRAERLIEKEGLHYKNLMVFEDDAAITYAISDSENRVRVLYKDYYREFNKAVVSKDMIGSSSATQIDMEGIEKLKERTHSVETAVAFLQTIAADGPSFVKPELVKIIMDINTNTSQRMLTAVLEWMSVNYTEVKHHKRIEEFMRLVVVHSYHLVEKMGLGETQDLGSILVTLKNLYLSTRSSDPELMRIRKLGQEIIKASAGKVNSSLEMATRTSVVLYITLRTFVSRR